MSSVVLRRLPALGLASALLAALPAAASEWRVADLWGGDVRALAIDPRDPDYVLAGTSSGQIFRSRDGSDTWAPAGDPGVFAGWSVQALIFDPNQTLRVWATLTRVWDETGFVAMSDDRGRSWSIRSDGLPRRQVYSLAAVPGSPGVLYAGTRVGVYGSRDHGRSWSYLTAAHEPIQKVTSLLVDPGSRSTVYAGTWRRVYRSDDSGATWRRLDQGMLLDSEVFSLQPVPDRPGELWASTCGWVYRGREGGDSWQRFSQGLSERRTPSFQVLPSGRRLAGTVDGVFVSEDDGASWTPAGAGGLAVHALTHHPARPDRIFAGTEGDGVWLSRDGGRTFAAANAGLSALRLAGLVASGSEIVAAVRHAGPASGVYSSFDGGLSYAVGPVRLPTVLAMAADGELLYAATEEGLYERRAGTWGRVESLGERRIDDVAAGSGRVLARLGEAVYEKGEEAFSRVSLPAITPRAMAVVGDTLWFADEAGRLYQMDRGTAAHVATPFLGHRLEALASRLLVSGPNGAWWGGTLPGWKKLGGEASVVLPTGDRHWPLLVVSRDKGAILRPAAGGDPLTLRLWVSPDAVTDALVRDQRLLVATVGYGVLMTDLPSRAAALPLAGPAQTGPRRREAESASERRSGRIAAARAGD